ncbi:unnamed protein product [Amoebophrya sp. A25]|nr:unnamed protein product [Amoebophrya sp. A25]|eukprot:GSA25T00005706001.1
MRDHMQMRKRRRSEALESSERMSGTSDILSSGPPVAAGVRCPLKGRLVPVLYTGSQLYLVYPEMHTFCRVSFMSAQNNPNVKAKYQTWDMKVSTLAGSPPKIETQMTAPSMNGMSLTKEVIQSLSLAQSIETMVLESPFLRPARSSPFTIMYKPKPKKRLPTLALAPKLGHEREKRVGSVSGGSRSGGNTASTSLQESSRASLIGDDEPTQQAELRKVKKPKGMHFANRVPSGGTLVEKARHAYAKRHESRTQKKIDALYQNEANAYARTLLNRMYYRAMEHVIRAQTPVSAPHVFAEFPRSALAASPQHPIGGRGSIKQTEPPLLSQERLGKKDDFLVDTNLLRYDCLPAEDSSVPWFSHKLGAGGSGHVPLSR